MKHVRSVALARLKAPPFAGVVDLEILQLRKVSPWIRWLYLELRILSDWSTGYLVTSWAQLEALMACDSSQAFVPSREALRRAVVDLDSLGLVERFADASEAHKRLFLKVLPAKGIGARSGLADRQADRPAKARSTRGNAQAPATKPTDKPTGGSAPVYQPPKPPSKGSLSTATKPTHTQRQMQSRMKPRGAGHP